VLLLNADLEGVPYRLPPRRFGPRWQLELSTAEPEPPESEQLFAARDEIRVEPLSLVLLRRAWS
jgi:hypothetical protein